MIIGLVEWDQEKGKVEGDGDEVSHGEGVTFH